MARLLFSLSVLPYCLLLVSGVPINHSKMDSSQSRSQMATDAPSSNIDVATLSTSLGEYYEGIADQVLISFTEKTLSSAQLAFKSKGDPYYQDVDPKMQKTFLHSLESHLHFLRGNLIASVQPLVDTNLPWVLSPTTERKKKKTIKGKQVKEMDHDDDNEDDDEDEDDNDDEDDEDKTLKKNNMRPPTAFPIWSIPLTRDIRLLNQRISTQLGRIVNANKTAHLMIHQSLARAKKTKLTVDARLAHSLAPPPYQVTFSYPVVEEARSSKSTLKNKPGKLQWNHRDLETWLQRGLLDIEKSLKTEFNKRIQDAVQCIMEDFSV